VLPKIREVVVQQVHNIAKFDQQKRVRAIPVVYHEAADEWSLGLHGPFRDRNKKSNRRKDGSIEGRALLALQKFLEETEEDMDVRDGH
jgi:hypothetical protein